MKSKIKFIVEPKDVLSEEMSLIRGGNSDSIVFEADIKCGVGRVKCKKDGKIESSISPLETFNII